jgi:hypothetical protein
MARFAPAVCALALVVLLCGGNASAAGGLGVGRALPAAGVFAGSSGAPESESAAHALATAILGELPLPAGATASSSEPSGDRGLLAGPGEGPPLTPNVVDDHAWWIVPGSPAEVRAYIDAHLSPGSSNDDWAASTSEGVTDLEFAVLTQLQLTGTPGVGELVVSVVSLPGGSTGLRADAQVVWLTPRPASEAIPPGARLLWINVFSGIEGNQPRQRPLRIVSSKRIDAIVALLNALPAAQPGLRSCPADFGIRVRLRFYARRGTAPLAVAQIDPGGCGGVELTLDGTTQPQLETAGPLIAQIDRVLGRRIDVTPPRRRTAGG